MNPLLDFSGLPRFADFKTEHVTPAVDTLLAECNTVVNQVELSPKGAMIVFFRSADW